MAGRTDQEAIDHPPAESSSSSKRRQPESGGPSRKRLRYVAQACDQCKRQKVRCNGRKPCNRCERLRPRECCYQGGQHFYNCPECRASNSCGASAEENGEGAHAPDGCSSSDSSCRNTALLPTLLETVKAQAEKLDLLVERTRMFDTHITVGTRSLSPPNPAPSLDCQNSNQESGAWKPLISTAMLHPEPRPLPPFRGPTSSSFLIGLAHFWLDQKDKNIDRAQREPDLAEYEISSFLDHEVAEVEEGDEEEYMEAHHPVHGRRESPALTESGRKLSLDPLQELNSDEAIRLIRQYDDLIGTQYPFIETEVLIQQTRELYLLLQASSSTDFGSTNALVISMDINNIHILKMVLAIALICEGTARRALGCSLFESLQDTVLGNMWKESTNMKDLVLMTLVGLYYFHTDKLQVACRLSSTMVRLALELGLHRRSTFSRPISDGQNLVKVVNAFWSIYVLDRQWSFAFGLPISLQETDIDPDLPEPDDTPFLRLMIRYARIGDLAWNSLSRSISGRLVGSRTSHDFRTALESLEFHEYQLDQWQRSIPEELQFSHVDHADMKMTFLRTVLHLRANQMRIIMIRPFLYLDPSSDTQLGKSITAMEVAGDTIQIIADLHSRGDMYRRQQALFNHFLVSALGLLYVLIIRDTVKEPLSSITGDRLSPHALAKAYSSLFCGLDVLRSLGTFATAPRRLWNKLFPIISRLKLLENHSNDSGTPVEYLSGPSLRPAAAYTCYTNSQGHSYSPPLDPALTTISSSTLDIASQSVPQALPDFDYDIMNIFELEEAYAEDDIYMDKDFGHHFIAPSNECTFAASFSELQAAYVGSVRPGTINWQNL
ncbi:uncharacterized protein PAC_17434 [Phialocephala subalpina]|uniref:Zn(2)-C6 fungal-type domain-containing protein n=1 Tax=Phialocephala subalpina TaxID=576137 RepID=A0A1L7XRA0_9HELO|nr:uncharacterized protein PAC_17434 [Phialocephala subalpina]